MATYFDTPDTNTSTGPHACATWNLHPAEQSFHKSQHGICNQLVDATRRSRGDVEERMSLATLVNGPVNFMCDPNITSTRLAPTWQ